MTSSTPSATAFDACGISARRSCLEARVLLAVVTAVRRSLRACLPGSDRRMSLDRSPAVHTPSRRVMPLGIEKRGISRQRTLALPGLL